MSQDRILPNWEHNFSRNISYWTDLLHFLISLHLFLISYYQVMYISSQLCVMTWLKPRPHWCVSENLRFQENEKRMSKDAFVLPSFFGTSLLSCAHASIAPALLPAATQYVVTSPFVESSVLMFIPTWWTSVNKSVHFGCVFKNVRVSIVSL